MVDILTDARALAIGLLIGDDHNLSATASRLFQAAGIQHLTAASGANLSLMVWLSSPLFLLGGYRLRYLSRGLVYGIYWLVAGGSGSLWRATVMAFLLWLSDGLGRKVAPWYILLAVITVGQLGRVDYYRTKGFWLSAAAVLGLLFSQKIKPGENIIALLPQWQKRIITLFLPIYFSLIVTGFVLPFLWQFFGQFSINSAFSTVLAGPFILPLQLTALIFFGLERYLRSIAAWAALCLTSEYRFFTYTIRQFVYFSHSIWFVLFSVISLALASGLGFRVWRLMQRQRRCQWRYQIWRV